MNLGANVIVFDEKEKKKNLNERTKDEALLIVSLNNFSWSPLRSLSFTVCLCACAWVREKERVSLCAYSVQRVCAWSGRAAHTSSFNDALANATCTFDKDEWCSWPLQTAERVALSHTHSLTHTLSVSLKSTVSKPEHLGSVEAQSSAIGAKSLILLSRLLTMINAWTLGPLCVIMGTHKLPPATLWAVMSANTYVHCALGCAPSEKTENAELICWKKKPFIWI